MLLKVSDFRLLVFMKKMKTIIYLCFLTLTIFNLPVNAGNKNSGGGRGWKNTMPLSSINKTKHKKKLDKQLRKLIKKYSLTGNPLKNRTTPVPDVNSPVAQLGMELFFSKALGGDRDSACVTCHHPMLGGG